jgi:hypothetical protein
VVNGGSIPIMDLLACDHVQVTVLQLPSLLDETLSHDPLYPSVAIYSRASIRSHMGINWKPGPK